MYHGLLSALSTPCAIRMAQALNLLVLWLLLLGLCLIFSTHDRAVGGIHLPTMAACPIILIRLGVVVCRYLHTLVPVAHTTNFHRVLQLRVWYLTRLLRVIHPTIEKKCQVTSRGARFPPQMKKL